MGATSFNQDLCAWGDKFPYDNAYDIFANSGCTYQDDPQEDQKGAFCASDCNGDTHSTAPKSSGAYKYVPIFTVTSWSLMSILSVLLGFYQ